MTSSNAPVRLAQPSEANDIFHFLIELYEENALFRLSEYKAKEAIKDMLDRNGVSQGLIGVIDGKNGYEASVGMVIGSWWYSDDPCIEERWNFVHPDHRKSTHAKKLIEFTKSVSLALNHTPMLMGILSNQRTEAKIRLYQRQLPMIGAFFGFGFEHVGTAEH